MRSGIQVRQYAADMLLNNKSDRNLLRLIDFIHIGSVLLKFGIYNY